MYGRAVFEKDGEVEFLSTDELGETVDEEGGVNGFVGWWRGGA